LPFPGEDDLERDINSKNMELAFSLECPAVVVEAIKKMTRKDWKDRITIDQALSLL
jgi:BioD-like phosphotransacetylase family protein